MLRIQRIAGFLLGLIFVSLGLNGLFPEPFIPIPPMAPAAQNLLGCLQESGYLMTTVKLLEVVGGLLLLLGRYERLALLLLGPIVVNILLFHAFLDLPGLAVGLVLLALFLMVALKHRLAFEAFLRP